MRHRIHVIVLPLAIGQASRKPEAGTHVSVALLGSKR